MGCFHLIFNLFVPEAVPGNSIHFAPHTPTFRPSVPVQKEEEEEEEDRIYRLFIEQTTPPLERTNEPKRKEKR